MFNAPEPTGDRVISDRSLLYNGESRSGVETMDWFGVDFDVEGIAKGTSPGLLKDKFNDVGGKIREDEPGVISPGSVFTGKEDIQLRSGTASKYRTFNTP